MLESSVLSWDANVSGTLAVAESRKRQVPLRDTRGALEDSYQARGGKVVVEGSGDSCSDGRHVDFMVGMKLTASPPVNNVL